MYVYKHTHIYTYTYIYIYVYIYVCIYIYIYIIYLYIRVYIYIYICMYNTCIYIYHIYVYRGCFKVLCSVRSNYHTIVGRGFMPFCIPPPKKYSSSCAASVWNVAVSLRARPLFSAQSTAPARRIESRSGCFSARIAVPVHHTAKLAVEGR